MRKFLLYNSAILSGCVKFDHASAMFSPCDPETGELQDAVPLEPPNGHYALRRLAFDLCGIVEHYDELISLFASSPEGLVRAQWGDLYSKEGNALYAREKKFGIDVYFEDGEPYAFCSASLYFTNVLVREGMEHKTHLATWKEYPVSRAEYKTRKLGTFMVPMRDGVRLQTHVWLPVGLEDKQLPTILVRTPYNASMLVHSHIKYARLGYALVLQDLRGREESEGEYIGITGEIDDGSDTLDWIAAQPWSDGKVGTIGGSYGGFVQWSMAASGNPHLACIVSFVTAGGPFTDVPRQGGTLANGMLPWVLAMAKGRIDPAAPFVEMQRDDWDEIYKIRPISEIPKKAFGFDIKTWTEWTRNESLNEFWKESDWPAYAENMKAPAMIVSGWFDDDHFGTQYAWDIVQHFPKEKRFLLLGPWLHAANCVRDTHACHMGNNAQLYEAEIYWQRWFDYHLKGIDTGFAEEPGVKYYMLGTNEWRTSEQFPPADYVKTSLYLGPDGTLGWTPPEPEGSVSYDYDPKNPAPHLIDPSENELSVPGNYKDVEKRPDVVCFTLPITEPTEVVGEVVANLYAASSALDTDWMIRLTRVDREGNSVKMAEGVLRAKFREGFDKIVLLTPGKPEEYRIRMSHFAMRFDKGDSIRVHITSSAERFFLPNDNTGKPMTEASDPVVAHQTILFGGRYPSRVTLHMKKTRQ